MVERRFVDPARMDVEQARVASRAEPLDAQAAGFRSGRTDDVEERLLQGALVSGARMKTSEEAHQYPLGVPMSLPRRLALLRWASHTGAWVVEDDYDSEFRYGARPVPCLHGLDVDGRVIYVGSFSKTLFPSLRLGFLIVPPDLQGGLVAARAAADQHPPVLDQAVLADFIGEGHFARHLRRMRVAYRERLDALTDAAARYCRGALRLRPTRTGLHAIADLEGADAARVSREAAARGVEATPLSAYFARRGTRSNALVLGFAAVRPEAARRGMERLAAAIEGARRGQVLHSDIRSRASRHHGR